MPKFSSASGFLFANAMRGLDPCEHKKSAVALYCAAADLRCSGGLRACTAADQVQRRSRKVFNQN